MTSNNLKRLNINRNSFGIFFVVVFVIYFLFFLFYWGMTTSTVRDIFSKNTNRYEIKADSVSTSGFLLINTKVKNAEFIGKFDGGKNVKITVEKINIKSIPFSKNYMIVLNGDINFIANQSMEQESKIKIAVPKNFSIQFNLTKDNKIKNIFSTADKITFSDQDEIDIVDFFDISFERYMLDFDESQDSVFRFNVDNIIETEKTSKEIKKYENNLEMVVTMSTKLSDENKSVVSTDIEINKFIVNDITNNFGFEIDGNYSSNFVAKNTMMDFLLKVVNYNSMLRAINSKSHFIMVDTKVLSQIIEMLTLAPNNYKNTKFDKYYSIKYNRSQKSITINNETIENLVKKNFMF